MISKDLVDLLEELDLLSNKAVYFRHEEEGEIFNNFSAETYKKIEIIKPDAFYVFNNQPYILFFDLSSTSSSVREGEIHKQVWSFDNSPIIFIVKSNEIKIFNAFNYDKKKDQLQEINLNKESRKKVFSFWNLQSGESWKWLQVEYYKNTIDKKRVNQKLFENIKLVRKILIDTNEEDCLSEDEANILILRLIFIRYLIDRNVALDPKFINGTTIIEKRKSFSKLIENAEALNIFFGLINDKLNGVLFEKSDLKITDSQAKSLSIIFEGKNDKDQQSLFEGADFYFEIFDFSIISVEVISGIYESLISPETRNEQSAIYTPSFLVDYILTETVDKHLQESHTSECKIFDPACGSGIFLVQSYRRMIEKEKEIYGDKIAKDRLKEIAQTNLFGIDLNEQALKVTCFSIYIALLDYQDPKTILDNFVFPKLIGENLFVTNFFDTEHTFNSQIRSKNLNFIVGNPPWKSNKEIKHITWLKNNRKITGRYEIAQSFLLRSKDFMNVDTVSALIVTSTIFYNISGKSKGFKKDFLTQFCLDKFFDLSPVRRLIFEEKNSPATIVYYRLSNGKNHWNNIVKHISIKSNIFLKHFKTLIIEKQDYKEIKQKHFIDNDWMFKLALYGGALDFSFLRRLKGESWTLKDLVVNGHYRKGDGIYRGTPKDYFDFLIGKTVVETEEIKQYYTSINEDNKLKKEDVYLESGRKEKLFDGEIILLKHRTKDEKEIIISYSDKPVVFRHGVYGITSKTNPNELKVIYGYLISRLYTYFQFLTSSAWGIATRPEIKLDEHISFPYIQLEASEQLEITDLTTNFISTIKDWYKEFNLGEAPFPAHYYEEINALINRVYQVSPIELDLIDYVYEVSRYQFQESKQHMFIRKVNHDTEFLKQYVDVFVKEFSNTYNNEYLQIDIYPLNYFIAINFTFSKSIDYDSEEVRFVTENINEKLVLNQIASSLSISKIVGANDASKNLYIQKDIKGFEENSFYIIKPNEFKCWHRAIAWHDVAEIREAIEQAETNFLIDNSHGS